MRCALLVCLGLAAVNAGAAEDSERAASDSLERACAVKVYPDGSFDWDYMKREIPYVNYVRERLDAELYLSVRSRLTGAGGYEYTIAIVGQKQFAGMNDTLLYFSKATDASETVRAGVLKALKMALMRYVARTPISDAITIAYRGKAKPTDVVDRWDSWIFSLSFTPGLAGSQVDRRANIYSSISADRVTPELKVSLFANSSYSESEQQLPSKTLNIIRRTNSFSALVVKSLGEHWGAGATSSAFQKSYMNKKRYFDVAPSIEYSIFPYAESLKRSLGVFAQVVFRDVRYHEVTIYNKTAERLWSYRISLPGSIKAPWGSMSLDITWQQYLHDASIYQLSIFPTLSFQAARGLWLTISGYYYRLHDQVDQPRRTLTDEEILLSLQQLASTYEYSFSVGFSYTFGSIYSNVVNPRFLGD
jgi:hypothetical protein